MRDRRADYRCFTCDQKTPSALALAVRRICSSWFSEKHEVPFLSHLTKYSQGPPSALIAAAIAAWLGDPIGVGGSPSVLYVLYGSVRPRSWSLVTISGLLS